MGYDGDNYCDGYGEGDGANMYISIPNGKT